MSPGDTDKARSWIVIIGEALRQDGSDLKQLLENMINGTVTEEFAQLIVSRGI